MAKRKNGEGTFIKLANGKVRMRKQVGTLANGGQRVITVTGTSETDCIRKMKPKEESAKARNQEYDSKEIKRLTVTDLCMLHFKEHLGERNRLKPKAADRRESTIRNQIKPYPIGRMQAVGVTARDVSNHIENLINEGRLSVSSIQKALDVINAAYKWSKDKGMMDNNPCTPVLDRLKFRLKNLEKRNSSDGVVIVLSEEQENKLKKYVEGLKENSKVYKYQFGLSLLLLLFTGMRVGELCALRWKDWSESTGTLNIERTRNVTKIRSEGEAYRPNENAVKNYHARTIKLNPDAVEIVREIQRITAKKESDDYIVINSKNKPTNPSNFDANLRGFYEEVGFTREVSGAHILRRTCATNFHYKGSSVERIAAYLGDTPETIIKHYISLTKKIVADGEVLNVVEYPL